MAEDIMFHYGAEKQMKALDNIVTQNIDKFYVDRRPIIQDHKGVNKMNDKIPQSYLDNAREILSLLQPDKNLTSNGTAFMIAKSFTKYTCGTYLQIRSENKETKTSRIHYDVSKFMRNSDLYGACLVYRNHETEKIVNANNTEFYYNEEDNILYIARNVIIDGKDDVEYQTRYAKKKYMYIEIEYSNNTTRKSIKKIPYTDEIGSISQLGGFILFNNDWNDDWTGESVLAPVIQDIKSYELMNHYFNQGVLFATPKLLMPSELIEYDELGDPIVDLTNDVFVPTDATGDENSTPQMVQFNIQSKEMAVKLDKDLEKLLTNVGLDRMVVAQSNTTIEKTASEVASENTNMFATIEERRNMYTPQLEDLLEFLYTEKITFTFIPMQLLDFNSIANTISQLRSTNSISDEMAVRLLYPRMAGTEEETAEVARLKESADKAAEQAMMQKQQQVNNKEQNSSQGVEE